MSLHVIPSPSAHASRSLRAGSARELDGRVVRSVDSCHPPHTALSLTLGMTENAKPIADFVASSRNTIGEAIEKADAEFVRARTGYAIGGVPPIGHATAIRTFIDEDLLRFDRIWAAAGTPNAVFELSVADLPRITGGIVIRLAT